MQMIRLGTIKVTTEGIAEIGKRIAALEFPTVIVMEGGYDNEALGRNIVAFIRRVLNENCIGFAFTDLPVCFSLRAFARRAGNSHRNNHHRYSRTHVTETHSPCYFYTNDKLLRPPLHLLQQLTPSPTIAATPTFAFPTVTVNKQAHCRYGPSVAYLHAADLYPGDTGTVRGRYIYSNWLYIKFDKLNYFCWVAPSVVDVVGDVSRSPTRNSICSPLEAICTVRPKM